MKLKRIIALSLSAATLALSLTACGGSSSAASDNAQASDSNSGDAVTVKLGVVGSIYEDLWTPAKEKQSVRGALKQTGQPGREAPAKPKTKHHGPEL